MTAGPLFVNAGALFDPTRAYRYRLWRIWGDPAKLVMFIMLNPSTADEEVNDPTVRRCIGFAELWGFGGLEVCNAFALRSTDPRALRHHRSPVGPDNDAVIEGVARRAERVVLAWGKDGALNGRGAAVVRIIRSVGKDPYCLGTTKAGQPLHPLYLLGTTTPVLF